MSPLSLPAGKTHIPDMPIKTREELSNAIKFYLETVYKDQLNSPDSISKELFAPLIKQSLDHWGNHEMNWNLGGTNASGAAMIDRKNKQVFLTLNENMMREYWEKRNDSIGRLLFEAIAIKEGTHLAEYQQNLELTLEQFKNLNEVSDKYQKTMNAMAELAPNGNQVLTKKILSDPKLVDLAQTLYKILVNREFSGYSTEASYFKSNNINSSHLKKEFLRQNNSKSLYSQSLLTYAEDLAFLEKNNLGSKRLFKLAFILENTNSSSPTYRMPAITLALSLMNNDPNGQIIVRNSDGSFQLNYANPKLVELLNQSNFAFLD
jgi:hypothetical protein